MFTHPPRREGPEGGTDEKSIPLPGVTCAGFESLLDFFYTGYVPILFSFYCWMEPCRIT